MRRIGEQNLGGAIEFCSSLGNRFATGAGDKNVNVAAEIRGGRHRLRRRVIEYCVVVFSQQQNRHQRTPASFFSFDTSSPTLSTTIPAWRTGGSVVFNTCSRGVTSTP